MNILALDTEGVLFDDKQPWKGTVYGDATPAPFCWSLAYGDKSYAYKWEEFGSDAVQHNLDTSDLVVGFNFKHDVGWLRKAGVDISKIKVYDAQLAEFVLSRQTWTFPDMRQACINYGLPTKTDVVKEEYWSKGIENKDIPWPILSEYAANDTYVNLLLYHEQQKHLTPKQKTLVSLMSQDLLILQEMEWNGIKFDEELCHVKAEELDKEIEGLKKKLNNVYPHIPLNWGSGDQLSAFLYGGTVVEPTKVLDGFYKGGMKKGQPKYKNSEIVHSLPRLFTPVKGSELKKDGLYATNEPTLRKLKALRKEDQWVLQTLLDLAKLETLNSKYYRGLPELNKKMHWPEGKLHGNFNQTTAATGRLSSNKPNLQNVASELQDIFVSEYP